MKKSGAEPRIVFQDHYLLVLDKPAGIVVNRARTVKEKTLQGWIEEILNIKYPAVQDSFRIQKSHFAEILRSRQIQIKNQRDKDFYERSGIVHRLDKETSGLILVAKTPKAFENLQQQFKERKVKKKYLALVHGRLEPKQAIPFGPFASIF